MPVLRSVTSSLFGFESFFKGRLVYECETAIVTMQTTSQLLRQQFLLLHLKQSLKIKKNRLNHNFSQKRREVSFEKLPEL